MSRRTARRPRDLGKFGALARLLPRGEAWTRHAVGCRLVLTPAPRWGDRPSLAPPLSPMSDRERRRNHFFCSPTAVGSRRVVRLNVDLTQHQRMLFNVINGCFPTIDPIQFFPVSDDDGPHKTVTNNNQSSFRQGLSFRSPAAIPRSRLPPSSQSIDAVMMPSIGDLAQIFSRDHSSMGGETGGTGGTTTNPSRGGPPPHRPRRPHPPRSGAVRSSSPAPSEEGDHHHDGSYFDDPGLSVGYGDSFSTGPPLQQAPHGRGQQPSEGGSIIASSSFHVRHSWDSDAQFPIREIERIKRKTDRIRSQRRQQAQQQQQPSQNRSQTAPAPLRPQNSSDSGSPTYPSPPTLVRHELDDFDELDDKVRAFEQASAGWKAANQRGQQPPRPPSHHNHLPTHPSSSGSRSQETETDTGTGTDAGSRSNRRLPNARPHHAWSDDVSKATTIDDSRRTPTPPPKPSSFTSRAAQAATKTLLQGFHQNRSNIRELKSSAPAPPPADPDSPPLLPTGKPPSSSQLLDTSDPTTADESHDASYETTVASATTPDVDDDLGNDNNGHSHEDFQLHDLCGEAITPDDVAWRNALHLLSVQPELARLPDCDDGQGWTPLHICCLSSCEPPEYLIRALLYAYPGAAKLPDAGGRLPLHLVAASSGHPGTMRLLLREHPAALHHLDSHGYAPIHLLLRNLRVPLTSERAKLLLLGVDDVAAEKGATAHVPHFTSSRSLLQRRHQHLNLTLEELEDYRRSKHAYPVTTFRFGRREHDLEHEAQFQTYPADIRAALARLSQWKRQRRPQRGNRRGHREGRSSDDTDYDDYEEEDEEVHPAIEVELPSSMLGTVSNPAALAAPNSLHLPLHTLVYRAIVDKKTLEREPKSKSSSVRNPLEDDDDDPEQATSASSSSSSEDDQPLQLSVEHPLELLRLFVTCFPAALVTRDADGLTPLLVTLVKGDDPSAVGPSLEELQLLLGQDAQLPQWARDLPPTPEFPHPARMAARETRQLPLHLVAEELREWEVIRAVHQAYPGAVHEQDHLGRTPLHVALGSYRRLPVDPATLALLYSDRVAQLRDHKGKLPLELLVENPRSLPSKQAQSNLLPSWEAPSCASDTSSALVYQRLIHASLSGSARPRSRQEASELLRGLQRLPPWLREQACTSPVVQQLLLDDVAHPGKTFFVLLEGVLLVALIIVFRLQMEQFVVANQAKVELSTWYTYAVYGTATMWLTLEVSRWLVAANLGEFRHLVLFHPVSWINGMALFLAINTSVLLYTTRDDAQLYALGTAATGFLWISLMGYLSNWSYGASVFFGGLSKIVWLLVWPFIIFGCLVVAFSQMFYTLLQVNCETAIGTPVCTVRDAYRVVYMLLRGDSLVEGLDQLSARAIVLIASFLLCLALFTLSLVVLVVVAATKMDFESLSAASWWEMKLAYHFTGADLGLPDSFLRGAGCCGSIGISKRLERAWELLVVSLVGGSTKKRKYWYAGVPVSNFMTWPLWILAILIIPIWTALGAVTLGLLWPPQLRRFLFRPISFHGERASKSAFENASAQVMYMREEIRQLKVLSFERSGEMTRELQDLKELLHTAMKES